MVLRIPRHSCVGVSINGYQFTASEVEVVKIIQDSASNVITEEHLQQWFNQKAIKSRDNIPF